MLTGLWDAIVQTAVHWGYLGVFFAMAIEGMGLPFPGDAALAFFGYLSGRGQLCLPYVILAATLGSGAGSVVAFALGRRYGLPLLAQYGKYLFISPHSVGRTVRITRRFGPLVLLFGRLLPGIRSVSSYVAGVGQLSWPAFLACSFAGFLLFCSLWGTAGYALGEHAEAVLRSLQEYLIGTAVAVIIGVGTLLYVRAHRRRKIG